MDKIRIKLFLGTLFTIMAIAGVKYISAPLLDIDLSLLQSCVVVFSLYVISFIGHLVNVVFSFSEADRQMVDQMAEQIEQENL